MTESRSRPSNAVSPGAGPRRPRLPAGSRTGAARRDFTLTNAGEVRYLGAETPRLGIFVVDVGGAPRALVGPVAKGYETTSGVDERLDDLKAVGHEPKLAPWRASFAPPVAPTPRLGLRGHFFSCGDRDHPAHEVRIALRARVPLGKVTVTVLDHHGDPLGPGILVDIGRTWQTVAVRLPGWSGEGASPVESIGVHVHDLSVSGLGVGALDASSRPGVYTSGDFSGEEPPPPPRWEGTADFVFGGPPGTPISSPRPPTPDFPE